MRSLDRPPGSENLLEILRHADPLIARLTCASVRERQACILESRLLDLADQARGKLALDLQDVQQITSAGINALINAQNRCATHNAKLVLTHANDDVQQLLKITGLNRMLLVVNHTDDAIHYFNTRQASSHHNKRAKHAA